jgi:predicted glycoside hydrolase/deacetylase ChbG (UPF0249 family)
MPKIIINADDFGLSKIFNEKILELLEKGYLKSTTFMVNRITEDQKPQLIRLKKLVEENKISVGLHVEFNLEKPLDSQIEEQFKKFKKILGFTPSHVDYHKGGGNLSWVNAVNKFGEKKGLPVRHMEIIPKTKRTTYSVLKTKSFGIKNIHKFLETMKDNESCEVYCHPGEYDPDCKSSLNEARKEDYLAVIELHKYLSKHKNIKNISYNEL